MNGDVGKRPDQPVPGAKLPPTRRLSPEQYARGAWTREFPVNPDRSLIWDEKWISLGLLFRVADALETIGDHAVRMGVELQLIRQALHDIATDTADSNPKQDERRQAVAAKQRLAESLARAEQAYRQVGRPRFATDPALLTRPLIDTFSVRVTNCLEVEDIHNIGELLTRTADDLLGLRGFGQACLKEVREKLDEHGLTLCSVDPN